MPRCAAGKRLASGLLDGGYFFGCPQLQDQLQHRAADKSNLSALNRRVDKILRHNGMSAEPETTAVALFLPLSLFAFR